jgi:hypothetical protein
MRRKTATRILAEIRKEIIVGREVLGSFAQWPAYITKDARRRENVIRESERERETQEHSRELSNICVVQAATTNRKPSSRAFISPSMCNSVLIWNCLLETHCILLLFI